MADNPVNEDDWGAAMAEQAAAGAEAAASVSESATAEENATAMVADETREAEPVPADVFQPLSQATAEEGLTQEIDLILDIPVQLTVELGRTKIPIKNILQLAQGSVVELDGLAGEPMDVLVNGCLIAQGEVVVVNEKFGIRLTDIITPSERIRRLSR